VSDAPRDFGREGNAPFVDLHAHSTASDGSRSPADVARAALAAGLAAIALTDHDTTAGIEACAAACKKAGIAFVPGIEVSADPHAVQALLPKPIYEKPLGTLHILGLFVRHDAPSLLTVHVQMSGAREQRNPAIVDKLKQLGLRIDYDEVLDLARKSNNSVIGRPHIAQVLVHKGYAKTVQDAFNRYIGMGGAAYVRRDRLPPQNAIDAIHEAGGLAVLAHPMQLKCADDAHLEHFCAQMKKLGVDGIETRHSDHTAAVALKLEQLAGRLELLTSGGSDYHGSRKSVALGSQQVPASVYESLKAAAESRLATQR
jgi:predicted metal-dependent phosphoesterase TrpH